jgi:hypothetical protein
VIVPTAAETRAAERLAERLAKFMKLGNNEYISRTGYFDFSYSSRFVLLLQFMDTTSYYY